MGLHTKLYVTVLVLWLVLSELVTSCPQSCETHSATSECPYNVKLKENSTSEMLLSCCDLTKTLYSNRTFNKVTVLFPASYKNCFLNMTYPLLFVDDIVIRENNLTSIQIHVNNQYVKTIDMSSNKLALIKKGNFDNFENTKELNLRHNNIDKIEKESFIGLIRLESIDLSENKLSVLNTFLEPLKNLQKVNLSNNNIELIDENNFNNSMLQSLDLSYNNLKKVVPGALQLLPNLVQLLLTDNPKLGIAQPDIQLLVGSGRRLQQLDASRTGLRQVPEAFTHSVRFLSLDGNIITSVRCGDFDSYPLLQSLSLTKNEINLVEDDSLGRLESLLFLILNNNKLTAVPKSLTEGLKYLSINNNLINNLTKADFKNLSNLEILFLQSNTISYIEERTFSDLIALKVLDLSYNPVKTLSATTFDGPLSLRDLRLCYMNVSVPEKEVSFPMSSPESIQMLHLQSSPSLARQLLADSAALAALANLQYLDLRMNNLSEIRDDLIFYFGQLKALRLHGNYFNCNDEHWLNDWLNWNGTRSMANGETCYYATSAPTEEVEDKYNSSFSASDAFPSVHLYSNDEMITKLQKYYGYYKNKTENTNIKNMNISVPHKLTPIRKSKLSSVESNLIPDYFARDIHFPIIKMNDIHNKAKKIAKILDQNQHATDNSNMKLKQENLRSIINRTSKEEIIKYKTKHSLGKRLNTPMNLTVIPTNENIIRQIKRTNGTENEVITLNTNHGVENMKASEPLLYQSEKRHYTPYMVTIFITFLGLISIVFWAVFWLKQRRRITVEQPEQIEVAHISGSVLW